MNEPAPGLDFCTAVLDDGSICNKSARGKKSWLCRAHKNFVPCEVCIEEKDTSQCAECKYKICAHCLLSYLSAKIGAPTCPQCHDTWTFAQVKRKLGKKFTVFCERYGAKLLKKEEPVLRLLQPKVLILRELEQIYSRRRIVYEQLTQIDAQIAALRTKIKERNIDVRVTARCPVEQCRGFIMNDGECSLCKSQLCDECGEIEDNEHKCDLGIVESRLLIQNDSKPCPNCNSPVYAIPGGCCQMFCTVCLVAFDWNTCAIETGIVHNPHYKEYIKKEYNFTPRAEGEGHATLFWEVSESPPLNSARIATLARHFYREELHARTVFLVRLDTKKMQQQRLNYLAEKTTEQNFVEQLLDENSLMIKTVAALRIVEWAREKLSAVFWEIFARDSFGFFVALEDGAEQNYIERHLAVINLANSKLDASGVTKSTFRFFADVTAMFTF